MRSAKQTLALLAGLIAAQGIESPAQAQHLGVRPAFGFGLVSQGAPLTGKSGPVIVVGLPVTIFRYFALTPQVDLQILTKAGDENAICLMLENGGCLSVHDENFLDLALTAGAAIPVGRVRPYFEAGAVYMNSLAAKNPGERNEFLTPQLQGGLQVRTPIGRWSLSLRWRRIDRWRPKDVTSEYSFILGLRPGRSF